LLSFSPPNFRSGKDPYNIFSFVFIKSLLFVLWTINSWSGEGYFSPLLTCPCHSVKRLCLLSLTLLDVSALFDYSVVLDFSALLFDIGYDFIEPHRNSATALPPCFTTAF
jgi:hypothetical protein